ncbi:hypothetical protein HK099_001298 [Clydaea vesicula]|uniref:Uncharacterized protein n=1 Tax=Clydaea vesicula TaxID=447962 RepID=A0AAD5U3L2_9FUNG|nr:hypothetical protein HK099_001298 [Clydaea vesicula]
MLEGDIEAFDNRSNAIALNNNDNLNNSIPISENDDSIPMFSEGDVSTDILTEQLESVLSVLSIDATDTDIKKEKTEILNSLRVSNNNQPTSDSFDLNTTNNFTLSTPNNLLPNPVSKNININQSQSVPPPLMNNNQLQFQHPQYLLPPNNNLTKQQLYYYQSQQQQRFYQQQLQMQHQMMLNNNFQFNTNYLQQNVNNNFRQQPSSFQKQPIYNRNQYNNYNQPRHQNYSQPQFHIRSSSPNHNQMNLRHNAPTSPKHNARQLTSPTSPILPRQTNPNSPVTLPIDLTASKPITIPVTPVPQFANNGPQNVVPRTSSPASVNNEQILPSSLYPNLNNQNDKMTIRHSHASTGSVGSIDLTAGTNNHYIHGSRRSSDASFHRRDSDSFSLNNGNFVYPTNRNPGEDDDQLSVRSSTRSVHSQFSFAGGETLDKYRRNISKASDPQELLEYALHLVALAEAPVSSSISQKSAKKRTDNFYKEAVKIIKKLAAPGGLTGKQSFPEAQFLLAGFYGNGSLGLSIDHEKAFNLYMQASKLDHPASTYRTAVCYEVGAGTKRDYNKAIHFFRKAAGLNELTSMYRLGMILLNGLLGTDPDPQEGLIFLKRAATSADEKNPHALHELGILYEGGSEISVLANIVPDAAYAHDFFLRAAQLGYSPSQYKLGLCYEYGLLNLPINPRRSIAWYSRSAESGDPEAELALSGWYLTGAEGILTQSDTEAYLWARKAADKGLAKAEYAVAYYTENGVGVVADMEEARKWYLRAAGQGNKRAILRLKELKSCEKMEKLSLKDSFNLKNTGNGGEKNWRGNKDSAKDKDCLIM